MDERPIRLMRRHLADALRSLRQNRDVSIRAFTRDVPWTPSHVSRVETAQVAPSPELLEAYKRRFGGADLIDALVVAERIEREELKALERGKAIRGPEQTRRDITVEGDASEFVRAELIPSAIVHPGEFFTVVFHIRNAGRAHWTNRYLTRIGAPATMGFPWSPQLIPIPDALPGDQAEIPIPLRGAPLPGTAQILFKMSDRDGNLYFPKNYRYGLLVTVITTPNGDTQD